MPHRRTALLVAAGLLAGALLGPGHGTAIAGTAATLSVWGSSGWRTWWRADRAPARWSGPDSAVVGALAWRRLGPGLEWASLRLACAAPAWRAKLIIARLDPRELNLSLELGLTPDQRPAWTIERAPRDAVLAVNAGQFVGGMPWGWVAREGRDFLPPGRGPLASALTLDASGGIRWVHGDFLRSPAGAAIGFQSYPTLLSGDGVVPGPIQEPGSGVSHTHRDARLAIGEARDGRLLVVLTRFDAMGDITGALPLGPTTPEMAAIMGALGARDAMMLDGGISAQLLLRDSKGGETLRWAGMRRVPLALIARERTLARR